MKGKTWRIIGNQIYSMGLKYKYNGITINVLKTFKGARKVHMHIQEKESNGEIIGGDKEGHLGFEDIGAQHNWHHGGVNGAYPRLRTLGVGLFTTLSSMLMSLE
jgi:hypothetical protein